MTFRKRIAIGTALGLLLLWPTLALGQDEAETPAAPAVSSGGGKELAAEDDIGSAWEVCTALRDRERVSLNMRTARQLLKKAGADLDQDVWDDTIESLERLQYTDFDSEASRKIALGDVEDNLDTICKALRSIVPPVAAYDFPNDDGLKLVVAWRDVEGADSYKLQRRDLSSAEPDKWSDHAEIDATGTGGMRFDDDKKLRKYHRYQYRLIPMANKEPFGEPLLSNETETRPQWFSGMWFFIFLVVICSAVVYYIQQVKSGKDIYIRKIAGLEAVDEAVGRATEMGRPILFIPGIQDITDIQTVAGLIILGRVAQTAAEHDAVLEVPTSRSLVMTTARETVKTSYANAGRPDAYDEKRIYYTTDEQFAYVAAVTGVMVREKPATCFYMGAFYAESLILAETANTTGSIQIAGTAQPAQLPFFVAACDYTLIGEEFFAASAYLSGEPHQLGSLKGQDVGKIIVALFIVVGVILATVITLFQAEYSWFGDTLDFIQNDILDVAE
ncbi:MAG: hypothetical protein JXO22_17000 [Phycisphaerae bacterium]|nr:hypothetical protein [Phycisphaerae bacterium]